MSPGFFAKQTNPATIVASMMADLRSVIVAQTSQ